MAEGGKDSRPVGGDERVGADGNSLWGQLSLGRGVLFREHIETPVRRVGRPDTPVLTSTRYDDHCTPGPSRLSTVEQGPDMSALITQLADQIGQSIAAKLQSEASRIIRPDAGGPEVSQPAEMTLSNVKLVMQSDAKEPPLFRGDGSDKFTVREWETLMSTYLRKKGFPLHEHSQEIQSRLMGKASDVVKVRLRNDPSIQHVQSPSLIFDILKHHFGEISCSTMPLADFYETQPAPGETAMDYWLRLNKAMDIVDECLQKRGRAVSDPQREVCLMFIQHCPDPCLANIFQLKSAEEWSACEIQEKLDESMRKRTRAAVLPYKLEVVTKTAHSQVSLSQPMTDVPVSSMDPVPAPAPVAPASDDAACMKRLVSLLDRMIMQQTQAPVRPRQMQNKSCKVCRGLDHSTVSHCRQDNLCLRCFAPGHWRNECPSRAQQGDHIQYRGSTQGSGPQGN